MASFHLPKLSMNDFKRTGSLLAYATNLAFAVMSVAGLLWTLYTWIWADIEGQCTLCAYLWQGINPYLPVSADVQQAHGLPEVPQGFGTSPWGLILGQLFYPGFLSLATAKVYFIALYIAGYLFTAFYAARNSDYPIQQTLLFCLLASISYFTPMSHGNAGGLFCLLLLWALYLSEKSPVLAGVCLSLALIKPQASLLFCLYFILRKQYRTLFIAAVIDLTAWGLAAIILKESPWQLLADFFACDIGASGGPNSTLQLEAFKGILTLAADRIPHAMYVSMILGTAYALAFYYINKNKGYLQRIAPFCVATAFWSYTFGNEMFICFPVVLLAYQNMTQCSQLAWIRWAFVVPYVAFSNIILDFMPSFIFHYTGCMPSFHLIMTIYLAGLIACMYKYSP